MMRSLRLAAFIALTAGCSSEVAGDGGGGAGDGGGNPTTTSGSGAGTDEGLFACGIEPVCGLVSNHIGWQGDRECLGALVASGEPGSFRALDDPCCGYLREWIGVFRGDGTAWVQTREKTFDTGLGQAEIDAVPWTLSEAQECDVVVRAAWDPTGFSACAPASPEPTCDDVVPLLANPLGTCQVTSEGATGSTGGLVSCDAEYACDAGSVRVTCTNDGTTESCSCWLDGGGSTGTGGASNGRQASCENAADQGCDFPASCCHAALGAPG